MLPPWVWLLHVRVETRHVHAERHLAKAGVARRKGRGLPTGAKRRRPKAGLHKRSAEDWGYPCAARSGQSPLAHGLSIVLDREADVYRVGVAGGNGPLRWVAEAATQPQRGRKLLPQKKGVGIKYAAGIFSFYSPRFP